MNIYCLTDYLLKCKRCQLPCDEWPSTICEKMFRSASSESLWLKILQNAGSVVIEVQILLSMHLARKPFSYTIYEKAFFQKRRYKYKCIQNDTLLATFQSNRVFSIICGDSLSPRKQIFAVRGCYWSTPAVSLFFFATGRTHLRNLFFLRLDLRTASPFRS